MQLTTVTIASDKHMYPRRACPLGYQPFNEDWYISARGDMRSSRTDYDIDCDSLELVDWMSHLIGKRWFDASTFRPAYIEACRIKRMQSVEVNIYY